MKETYLLFALLFILPIALIGQENTAEVKPCGITEITQHFYDEYPEEGAAAKRANEELEAFTQNFINSRIDEDTVYIPIVFHIIHMNGPENLSNEVIRQSVDRLNIDYQALNSDTSQVVEPFRSLIPVTNIFFRLATIDPEGNCTSGITRTYSTETNNGINYIEQPSLSNLIHWPREKYLNVYVVRDIVSGAAAYTYNPGPLNNNPQADAIVNRYDYLGANQRTLTHEVGHWFNLSHTWGSTNEPALPSNCSSDDFVSDTPNTIGNSGGCNTSYESCGSLDNIQNYMNYASCSINFTQGQSDRMRASVNSGIAQRNNLWTPENLAATGIDVEPTLCTADFFTDVLEGCTGTEVEFFDNSFNGEITSWEWTFEGGTPSTSTEKNPSVIYSEGGSYDVSLTVGDGQTTVSATKVDYVNILPVGLTSPYIETFANQEDLPNDRWEVTSENSLFFKLTDQAAAVGTHSTYLRNRIQPADQEDEMISSTVSLAGVEAGELTFKYAYAKKSDANTDILRVWISRNCGETWVQKKQIKASTGDLVTGPNTPSTDFYPTEDQWAEASVNLSSLYYIDNFRFKFQFISGGGNNLFIDDIRVFDPTVGINQINKANLGFQVFPNPVSQDVTLEFNLLETHEVRAELYDLTGRQIDQLFVQPFGMGTHRFVYDASALKSGMYMIRLTLAGESFTTRLVKE